MIAGSPSPGPSFGDPLASERDCRLSAVRPLADMDRQLFGYTALDGQPQRFLTWLDGVDALEVGFSGEYPNPVARALGVDFLAEGRETIVLIGPSSARALWSEDGATLDCQVDFDAELGLAGSLAAVGDADGNGRQELAVVVGDQLRIFAGL